MQVEIKVDSSAAETRIIILTPSITDEVNDIVKKLIADTSPILSGLKDERIEILEPDTIINIYADAGRVLAVTTKGEYVVKLRLYELETRLPSSQFIRISNSEIINLKKVKNFDLSITGTICIKLFNGTTAYVSRRYVSKLKKLLGI